MPVACSGCTASQFAAGIDYVARGASWLASAIDAGESGADRYFARHPNGEREEKVAEAVHRARLASEALDAALAVAGAAAAKDYDRARTAALDAYQALVSLLSELGVLDALPPAGGAEAEGVPEPEPFSLPTVAEVGARL